MVSSIDSDHRSYFGLFTASSISLVTVSNEKLLKGPFIYHKYHITKTKGEARSTSPAINIQNLVNYFVAETIFNRYATFFFDGIFNLIHNFLR